MTEQLLRILQSRPNRAVELSEITTLLYGCDGPSERHAVRNLVYHLRKKGENRIQTAYVRLIWRPDGVTS